MKASRRAGVVLGGLGLGMLVAIAYLVSGLPDASFENLDQYLVAIGLALFGGSLMTVGAMLYFREMTGGGDDNWGDWRE